VSPLRFRLRGTIADIDETVVGEPAHPTVVVIIDSCDQLTRIVIPPGAKSASRELLAVGRPIVVSGEIDFLDALNPLPQPVATRVELLTTFN
jgi:hypothetical protein